MGNDKAVKDKAVCYSNRVEWLQRELDGLSQLGGLQKKLRALKIAEKPWGKE